MAILAEVWLPNLRIDVPRTRAARSRATIAFSRGHLSRLQATRARVGTRRLFRRLSSPVRENSERQRSPSVQEDTAEPAGVRDQAELAAACFCDADRSQNGGGWNSNAVEEGEHQEDVQGEEETMDESKEEVPKSGDPARVVQLLYTRHWPLRSGCDVCCGDDRWTTLKNRRVI